MDQSSNPILSFYQKFIVNNISLQQAIVDVFGYAIGALLGITIDVLITLINQKYNIGITSGVVQLMLLSLFKQFVNNGFFFLGMISWQFPILLTVFKPTTSVEEMETKKRELMKRGLEKLSG